MVVAPVLLMCTSPDIATPVATFEALPTNIKPDDNVLDNPPLAARATNASVAASYVKNPIC